MNGSSGLSELEHDIVLTLTKKVKVVSYEQIGRTWFRDLGEPTRAAKRTSRKLVDKGFLKELILYAGPEIPMPEPLALWHPGIPVPILRDDLQVRPTSTTEDVMRLVQKRLQSPDRKGALRRTPSVMATKHAARQFGGFGGRPPKATETTHDIRLATVYLQMRDGNPKRAETWISEREIEHQRHYAKYQKLPDAMVFDPEPTAIELGGEYLLAKLTPFHHYCVAFKYAYEIW